jgi:hypothetical protein
MKCKTPTFIDSRGGDFSQTIIINGKSFDNITIFCYSNLLDTKIECLDYILITNGDVREYFEKLQFRKVFDIELNLSNNDYKCFYKLKAGQQVNIYNHASHPRR